MPRVIGQTERARQSRAAGAGRQKTTQSAFLEACPLFAKPFFEDLLATAQQQGLVVYWGERGLSIRAVRPDGKQATLMYGYPPSGTKDVPLFQVYLGNLTTAENPEPLRTTILEIPGFQQGGQYTLGIDLKPEALDQARSAIPHVIEVSKLVKTTSSDA